MAQAEVKVIILGDYGVGKTTFVKRSINGSLAKLFMKEHGCDVLPMMFTTNKCTLDFQVPANALPRRIPFFKIQPHINQPRRYGTLKGKRL